MHRYVRYVFYISMYVTAQQMHGKHNNLNPEQLYLPVESEIKDIFGDVALVMFHIIRTLT